MAMFVWQRRGGFTIAALTLIALAFVFLEMRYSAPALATSDGDPYTIPQVVDTNPDPNIVETTIVAEGALVDVGKKDSLGNTVMASVLTFNGSIPGPEFRLKVGDTVIVHFENHLGHATGIHWHGIELNNASDGTPLTQDQVAPVPPGGKFLYKFKIRRPGIYWYHPHHHSSTNQVFKGLYGAIIVTDPNEAALIASGVIPGPDQTRTLALSDLTVCNAPGHNDPKMYTHSGEFNPPYVAGGELPDQTGQVPLLLCETGPIDEDGASRGPFALGDVPNIQKAVVTASPTNEGQTVLTNGKNVGGRLGTPLLTQAGVPAPGPGALLPGAFTMPVTPGQGLRLQIGNTATIRFFRLILSDSAGTQIPLVRIGGQGGLLDNAHIEGDPVTPVPNTFLFNYTSGEILLDPGDRADVVAAIPASATGVLTLWTQDFDRTGGGFSKIPTVPVAHFQVTGSPIPQYTIGEGTPLRAAIGGTNDPVETLGAPTHTPSLLDPTTFMPMKDGKSSDEIKLTQVGTMSLGIDDEEGHHDPTPDFMTTPHELSARYAASLGDTLELSVTNTTNAHHPFHLHGFSIQPISLTKSGGDTYLFPYREFRDNVDVPKHYTLHFRLRLDDRPLMDGTTMGGGFGRWVFHCHIFFHATFGMISEFVVVDPDGNERPYIAADGVLVTAAHGGDPIAMTGRYHDPDGDAVTLSASQGTIVDSGDGVHWNWTANATTSGLVYVTATETSGGKKDQVAFEVQIGSPPVLTVPGPQSQDYHDDLTFGISATDPDGDPITLTASGLPAGLALVDNGNGTGTVSGTIQATPGVYVATFFAADPYNPPVSKTVEITVTKEETGLTYTGPTVILQGANATLSAVLKEELNSSGLAIAGATVNFTLGGQACSGATSAAGVAQCTITGVSAVLGESVPITANFTGNTFYLPSSTSATAVVFAFPTYGAFVVGNSSAAGGGTVTWWGSQWSKANQLSGGGAPSAFNGFAKTVNLPTSTPPSACGGPWSTSGGTSPPPTATVPSYMGTLVASSAIKSGTTVSGNTVSIVVVKVNPGFAPNGGGTATGTIVGTYCN